MKGGKRNPVAYWMRTNRIGAGTHKNKKAYNRKIKHKKKEIYS